MKRVIVESPYAGDVLKHIEYARAAMKDCLHRGEAPYASHLLYTQPRVLVDEIPEERELGIRAGFQWREAAEYTVFYTDFGWSTGMKFALENCKAHNRPWIERQLPEWVARWEERVR